MAKDDILNKIDDQIEDISAAVHKIDKDLALQVAAFEAHTKQDEHMYEELKRMNDILQSNTESLKEHMQQTQLLKDTVLKIDARLAPFEKQKIEDEAVKAYRNAKIVKFGKWIGIVATIVGIVATLKAII
jgi:hypothetical protein